MLNKYLPKFFSSPTSLSTTFSTPFLLLFAEPSQDKRWPTRLASNFNSGEVGLLKEPPWQTDLTFFFFVTCLSFKIVLLESTNFLATTEWTDLISIAKKFYKNPIAQGKAEIMRTFCQQDGQKAGKRHPYPFEKQEKVLQGRVLRSRSKANLRRRHWNWRGYVTMCAFLGAQNCKLCKSWTSFSSVGKTSFLRKQEGRAKAIMVSETAKLLAVCRRSGCCLVFIYEDRGMHYYPLFVRHSNFHSLSGIKIDGL